MLTLNRFKPCFSASVVNFEQLKPAGYANDTDIDDNNEDVDSTEFTTIWKIKFYFFKVGIEGWGPRAEDRGKQGSLISS